MAASSGSRRRRPRAALLVNYSEFNGLLAPRLSAAGVRVLWYGAPQVWAWRAGRTLHLRRSIDRLAVIFPFEEATWRAAGVDAHYVGHPALEAKRLARGPARAALGLTPSAAAVAVLPGSRPHEVRRLLVVLGAILDRADELAHRLFRFCAFFHDLGRVPDQRASLRPPEAARRGMAAFAIPQYGLIMSRRDVGGRCGSCGNRQKKKRKRNPLHAGTSGPGCFR